MASLSQNKEKEAENKILDIFIDLIENIKEILSIIDKIVCKGFPNEFVYIIELNDGIAKCKNINIELAKDKDILEEKSFLKKLLTEINKSQKKHINKESF